MLSRYEYNRLFETFEKYTDAWENYVKATATNSPSRFEKGVKVTDLKERLFTLLKEMK